MNLFSFSNCIHCGSFFPKSKLFCRVCENSLFESDFYGLKTEQIEEIRLRSLFDWIPDRSDSLSRLFLALKGHRQGKAWKAWAGLFWSEVAGTLTIEGPLYFFAAPGATGGTDHAALFAKALAEHAGGSWLGSLQKEERTHQRAKSKWGRKRLKVRVPVNIPRGRLILVDDIFTTGATARACFLALGKPREFEVWSLGKRTVACEGLSDLL